MNRFFKGQQLFTIGFNMECEDCVCKVEFIEYKGGNDHYDCIIMSSNGIKSWSDSLGLLETKEEVLDKLELLHKVEAI